jgi:cell division protein FtsI (penicillin-binding protein 3)
MKNDASKIRTALIMAVVTLAFIILAGRLVVIQVVHGGRYQEIAGRQSSGKIELRAPRGLVYDRAGREVATNVNRNALYAYPTNQNEIKKISRYLDKLYGRKSGSSKNRLSLSLRRFSWVDRRFSDEMAGKLLEDSVSGLYIRKEMERDYPFQGIGRQLLGCTDIDGLGISGLEFGYDSLLAGKPGLIDYLRDGQRNTYRLKQVPLVQPVPGNSIILTIDWYMQEIVEEELKLAVEKYKAQDGCAVFLDCHTGEILAAADYSADGKAGSVKLRAVCDAFEPGSVFKIFTAAALLEENLADPDEKIYCEKGKWRCGYRWLRDDKELDSLTFQELFELSSNIGIAKLAQRLGGTRLVENARKFGFGQKCYVGLPGEAAGAIGDPGKWSEFNIAALAMGHAIAVTPLQLASAIAAVANGGTLYRPQIVRGIVNSKGELVKRIKNREIARVMDDDNAEMLRHFMTGVVERGTAKPVQSEVISIAGKTGTAEIPDLVNGGYKKNKFMASFGGFFPAENPIIAGIVVLNQPEPIHYGGHTSGPTFKNIAERYAVANSDYFLPGAKVVADGDRGNSNDIPDFIGRDVTHAKNIAEKKGIHLSASGDEGIIIWQYPPSDRRILGNGRVAVLVEGNQNMMTDLTGFNLRTAITVLNFQGLPCTVTGSGIVKKQFPPAGTALTESTNCRLICGKG